MMARREKRKKLRKKKDFESKSLVGRARESCQATAEARQMLGRGQAQFAAGDFADAIETMKAVIRSSLGQGFEAFA